MIDHRPAAARIIGGFTTPAAMTIGGAARVPSTVRPVNVLATVDITCTSGQNRIVLLEVETGVGTGVYTAVGRWHNAATLLGITTIVGNTITVTVPQGRGYRFTQSGTGTAAIAQHVEQLA